MTDKPQELDEILTKLARETTLADRAADIATTADGVKVASKRFQWSIGEAKLAITDWHKKRELEARIDALEYAKISPSIDLVIALPPVLVALSFLQF